MQEKKICVFLGSRPGNSPVFTEHARRFAQAMVDKNIDLVFGGSNMGLMQTVSETVLGAGGHVTGVFPEGLFAKARASENLSELHRVSSMHERKALMAELSSGFVALPGGLGTLEEIFEALTWTQIGIHAKPCGFLNTDGYYDHLLAFLDNCMQKGFMDSDHRDMIFAESDPEILLDRMLHSPSFVTG
jgi:uncharacterized protein (TIGR00730 family)